MDIRKTILLLGGSAAQIIAIKKAKDLGYRTVLCDYLTDNPGQSYADVYYPESTTDKDAILQIAIKEEISGIVAYSSDPAAPTAAFVANKLNLPGINYEIACKFCEKQLFRKFLEDNGFNVPKSLSLTTPFDYNVVDTSSLRFPVIVKPTDSSGSKGITVLKDKRGLVEALKYAQKYSRNHTLIIEEFIERDHPYVIEAEIFALDGEVVSWGLINSIRDSSSNPLLPSAYSYPLDLNDKRKKIVKEEITRLIKVTGDTSGAFNIEMIIDANDNLYFLDAGPRNGGNMLPEYISMISGKDIVGATIKNAMGEADNIDVSLDGTSGGFWGLGVLHTTESGHFKGIKYSDLANRCLVREEIQKQIGDEVFPFLRCNDLIGLNFYHFETKSDMDEVMIGMEKSAKVLVQ